MHWQKKMQQYNDDLNVLLRTLVWLGTPLFMLVVVLCLTGCATETVVVREPCKYPMPPDNLMQQPQSLKWIRPELLPLPSSK